MSTAFEKAVEENPRFDLKVYSHKGDLNSMWINLRFNDIKFFLVRELLLKF